MDSCTEEGLTEFPRQNLLTAGQKEKPLACSRHRIELNIKWEVHQAMSLYGKAVKFATIATLNGAEIGAELAVGEEYINEHFTTG